MATFSNKFGAKRGKKGQLDFCCEICDYKCSKKYCLDRHNLTSKHIAATFGNSLATQKGQKGQLFSCEYCEKVYNDRTGLWRHNKKCCKIKETSNDEKTEPTDKELIMLLIKENSELKNIVMKVLENGTNNIINNANTNINTNTNSNNKAFNLNFFLNETCKNAMNITDFVDSIKLELTDLEKFGEIGYVEGISNIILKNLNKLDENVRPVHCTDKKRETMYVKDQGEWNKEDDKKTRLRKAINKIADKNIRLLSQFREKYPDYSNSSSKMSDKYDKMVIEVMETDYNKDEKIINNISKVTTIKENKFLQ